MLVDNATWKKEYHANPAYVYIPQGDDARLEDCDYRNQREEIPQHEETTDKYEGIDIGNSR